MVKQEVRRLQAILYRKFIVLNREIFSLIFEGQEGWKQGQFANKMQLLLQVGLIAVNIIGDRLNVPSYSEDHDPVSNKEGKKGAIIQSRVGNQQTLPTYGIESGIRLGLQWWKALKLSPLCRSFPVIVLW